MTKILILDDEPQLRALLARMISLEGYEVAQADTIQSALKKMSLFQPEIVLCDVFLPDGNGVDFVPQIKTLLPLAEVIMLTANGNIADGVQAMKQGAFDYLVKGDDNNRIVPLLAQVTDRILQKQKQAKLRKTGAKTYTFDSIIGQSKPLLAAVELARKVAHTDTSVLLTGETGTGKEVFANAIHQAGRRAAQNFVAVNCSALSHEIIESELFGYKAGAFTGALHDKKGLFEHAHQGTIFLDEIGDMPLSLQAKLLRTLENGEFIRVGDTSTTKVDVRIIAATNRNLKESVARAEFREDLYYRLSVFSIELPPLRERENDTLLLAQNFADAFAAQMEKKITRFDPKFSEALLRYPWNGNIRELRNTLERSVIMTDNGVLNVSDLPLEIQMHQAKNLNAMELSTIERQHICKVLHYTAGNKTETARLLKIGLTTLYRKIEEYQIQI